jgi:hypothetical protein
MAGYSGTPLPKKLGIKKGARVAFLNAPPGFAGLVEPLPQGVEVRGGLDGALDLVVFFTTARAELDRHISDLKDAVAPAGAAWVAWPKRSSNVVTDMTEDVVREVALPEGLVDTKVCAIDQTWSGLRLVIRMAQRAQGG